MILRHVRPHDQDRIGVQHVLGRGCGPAASVGCAQTGHSGAMSYPGLVADAYHPQARSEQFLDQIVFFIVERGTAEVADRGGLHQSVAVTALDEAALPALPKPVGNHLHGFAKFQVFPTLENALRYFTLVSRWEWVSSS